MVVCLFFVCRGNFGYVPIVDVNQTKRGKKRSSVVVGWDRSRTFSEKLSLEAQKKRTW